MTQPEEISDIRLVRLIELACKRRAAWDEDRTRRRSQIRRAGSGYEVAVWESILQALEELQRRREGEPPRVTSGERFAAKMAAQAVELETMLEVFK